MRQVEMPNGHGGWATLERMAEEGLAQGWMMTGCQWTVGEYPREWQGTLIEWLQASGSRAARSATYVDMTLLTVNGQT